MNPDVIAWIDIPGLSISYPVVQGTDNAYYLHHLFTGEYNSSGSIFADWHNQPDFADPNTIVYGHNMKNGSMFGTLSHYQDQALWEENPYFYLYVPGKVMEYQIFSCYAGYVGSEAYTYAFPEADDFQNFLGKIRSYAGYDTGVGSRGNRPGGDNFPPVSVPGGITGILSTGTGRGNSKLKKKV